jgi:hypothetical protein
MRQSQATRSTASFLAKGQKICQVLTTTIRFRNSLPAKNILVMPGRKCRASTILSRAGSQIVDGRDKPRP